MTLPVPDFITRAKITGLPVQHQWSQEDAMVALGSENPTVERKLAASSARVLLSLSAGLAEWLQVRFAQLQADPELEQLIEAVWAASIDFRYLKADAREFPSDDTDPVRGPMQECKRVLRWITEEAYLDADMGVVSYTQNLGSLVNYVLPDTKAFQKWLKGAMASLPALSAPSILVIGKVDGAFKSQPRGVVESVWGTPVPREALDPSFDPKAADSAKLIDELLQKIDKPGNPFLRSPAELTAMGMVGTPYRYSKPLKSGSTRC
jgi:hypothetical protein